MITIFTDGASRGNPGSGGWASIVVEGGSVTELGGAQTSATNNKMELTACIRGLEHTKNDQDITIYTDSSYVINGITKWIKGWRKNGWVTKTKQEVLNRDLWEELYELSETRNVKWEYVGGHVGIRGNERCDWIATEFADGNKPKLYDGLLEKYPIADIMNISHDAVKLEEKKSDSSRSRAPAYSYVSMVDGLIRIHKTWAECEKRVKGVRGTRFKKALNSDEEKLIVNEFGKK